MADLTSAVEKEIPKRGIRLVVPKMAMTLGFRLNLSITLLLVLILGLGTAFVILNARQDVAEETHSSAMLALRFLSVAEAVNSDRDRGELWQQLVKHIGKLEKTRHLDIVIQDHHGGLVTSTASGHTQDTAHAPRWFIRLVEPEPMEFRRSLGDSDREIIIRADPAGEITEAWNDARPLLALQFLFAILVEGLVFLTVGRAQKPLERVLAALEEIEQGRFQTRLPQFKLPEIKRISEKFNQMAEALDEEKKDNQRLARRAMSIQEQERRYLARELHDELGQSISAIKALSVSIRRRKADNPQRLYDNASSIVEIADQTYAVIKTMVYRLRPPALDELGLITALQRMVDNWNSHHMDTFCSLDVAQPVPQLSDEISINLYRIIQECLTNVAKHAQASRMRIEICSSGAHDGCLRVNIHDDGVGLSKDNKSWGLGLRGIHDRVAALDGTIAVSNQHAGGMAMRIVLPMV